MGYEKSSSETAVGNNTTSEPCDTKYSGDNSGVAVTVLSLFLAIFMVLTLVLAFVVLGMQWKHSKTNKKGKTLI